MKPIKYTTSRAAYALLMLFLLLCTACLKEDLNPASGTLGDYISLLDVRKIYKGEEVVLNTSNMVGATRITGVVISDVSSGNIPTGTMVLQQTSRGLKRGIEINFGAGVAVPYQFGDSLTIVVENATITRSQGPLQLIVPGIESVTKVAGNSITDATELNLATLNAKFSDYESTLVKISNVNVNSAGTTLSGNAGISEASGATGVVHTEAEAAFAAKDIPVNASFVGIPRITQSLAEVSAQQIWPVNLASISDESGALYGGFPETFENGDATITAAGYSTKTGLLSTGSYTLSNTGLNKEANDLAVSGAYALRMNQNSASDSWCAMNYDLLDGATKVTVWAGSYGASADLGSTWRLEYSQNSGVTWIKVGEDILTISKTKKLYTFLMDIRGKVRFRFGKKGIGSSTVNNQNGRFSLDDFSVYVNPIAGPIVIPMPDYTTVMGWQFGTPAAPGNQATAASTTINSGLNVGTLSRGAGLNASPLSRTFASNSAGPVITSTKELALSQNSYYQIAFRVKEGYKLSLSAINVSLRKTGAGAKYHCWYYSLDGLNFNPTTGTGDVLFEDTNTEGAAIPTYYVYETPDLQNIPSGKTITLRMYCWGFTNIASGSLSIGRTPAATSTDVLTLGGTVKAQ